MNRTMRDILVIWYWLMFPLPLLLCLTAWLLGCISGGRVQVHWGKIWRCRWLLLPSWCFFCGVVMSVLLAMTHPPLVASRYDSGAAWPESSVWLLGLLPAGCDRAGMELEEHFRGTVRERVVGYFAALLYAVVCSHLEQGLSQPSVLASVVRRLEELNHLTDAWQVGDAASGEAAATAEQLESAVLGLSELEAECGELLAQVRTQTSETAVLSAEFGEDSEVLCRLSGELTGLKSERDRLREKRLLVERLWVERQR